jgi:putative transcriptional regulator
MKRDPEIAPIIPHADVRTIRLRLNLSQEEFAETYALSVGSIRNWERGIRIPEHPARLLLHLIADDPERIARAIARIRTKPPR